MNWFSVPNPEASSPMPTIVCVSRSQLVPPCEPRQKPAAAVSMMKLVMRGFVSSTNAEILPPKLRRGLISVAAAGMQFYRRSLHKRMSSISPLAGGISCRVVPRRLPQRPRITTGLIAAT
jgi:hypothetical protein